MKGYYGISLLGLHMVARVFYLHTISAQMAGRFVHVLYVEFNKDMEIDSF
jgi:hypothetical protein